MRKREKERTRIKKKNCIMEHCSELKQKYDACFNSWFSEKFLKGNTNDSMCASLLKVYKDCVVVSLKSLFLLFACVLCIYKIFQNSDSQLTQYYSLLKIELKSPELSCYA